MMMMTKRCGWLGKWAWLKNERMRVFMEEIACHMMEAGWKKRMGWVN